MMLKFKPLILRALYDDVRLKRDDPPSRPYELEIPMCELFLILYRVMFVVSFLRIQITLVIYQLAFRSPGINPS